MQITEENLFGVMRASKGKMTAQTLSIAKAASVRTEARTQEPQMKKKEVIYLRYFGHKTNSRLKWKYTFNKPIATYCCKHIYVYYILLSYRFPDCISDINELEYVKLELIQHIFLLRFEDQLYMVESRISSNETHINNSI